MKKIAKNHLASGPQRDNRHYNARLSYFSPIQKRCYYSIAVRIRTHKKKSTTGFNTTNSSGSNFSFEI